MRGDFDLYERSLKLVGISNAVMVGERLNEWSLDERSRSEREKEEKEEAQGVWEERPGFVAIRVVQT